MNTLPELTEGFFNVIAVPHPLKQERLTGQIEVGNSIGDIFRFLEIPLGITVRVIHNDGIVEPSKRETTYPKSGDLVILRVLAGSGGGGSNANKFAQIGLMVTAVLLSWTGVGELIIMAVMLIGELLIHALIPPTTPTQPKGTATPQHYTLSGNQNTLAAYSPLGRVYGSRLIYPTEGSSPYNENVGVHDYLRMLLVNGYGPLDIKLAKIGQTLLNTYHEVEWEIRAGYPDDAPSRLYTQIVAQQDVNITLLDTTGGGISPLGWQTVTSGENADQIGIDLTFPQGLYTTNNVGNHRYIQLIVNVQYQLVGVDHGSDGNANWILYGTGGNWSIRATSLVGFTRNVTFSVNTGQYDVRVQVKTVIVDGSASENTNTAITIWSALRTFTLGAPITQTPPPSLLAFRIRASNQLSGSISNLNCVATSILPVWDGTSWNSKAGSWQYDWDNSPGANVVYSLDNVTPHTTGGRALVIKTLDGASQAAVASKNIVARAPARKSADWQPYPGDVFTFQGFIKASQHLTSGVKIVLYYSLGEDYSPVNNVGATVLSSVVLYNGGATTSWAEVGPTQIVVPIDTNLNFGIYMTIVCYHMADGIGNVSVEFDDFQMIYNPSTGALGGSIAVNELSNPSFDYPGQMTSNPAEHVRDALEGNSNGQPVTDAAINMPALIAWLNHAKANQYFFNGIFDQAGTVTDTIRKLAAIGRAFYLSTDTLFNFVIDEPQTSPSGHWSERNSWNLQSAKNFPVLPHGLRVQFVNSKKLYIRDEVVAYDDGYSPRGAEEIFNVVIATGDGVSATIAFSLPQPPVQPGSLTINSGFLHGVYEFTDSDNGDGTGTLTAVRGSGSGTITYKTGVGSVTLGAALPDEQIMTATYMSYFGTIPATIFEQLDESEGVTDAIQAWKDGRYHLAVGRLRPETYTWDADIESIGCEHGDLQQVRFDLFAYGRSSGRISSVIQDGSGNLTGVILDENLIPFSEGVAYAARFRLGSHSGLSVLANVNNPLNPIITALTGPGAADSVSRRITVNGANGQSPAVVAESIGTVSTAGAAIIVGQSDPGTIFDDKLIFNIPDTIIVEEGDLLVVSIVITGSASASIPDSTWTLIESYTNGAIVNVFTKVAGVAEAGPYTFPTVGSVVEYLQGGLVILRNVATTPEQIITVAGSGGAVHVGTVTPTHANDLLLAVYGQASGSTFTNTGGTTDLINGGNHGYAIVEKNGLANGVGVTGITGTSTDSSDAIAAVVLVFSPLAGVEAGSVAMPSGTVQGELIFVHFATDGNAVLTPPTGFSVIATDQSFSQNITQAVAVKVAGPSETGPYAFTWSVIGTNTRAYLAAVTVSGAEEVVNLDTSVGGTATTKAFTPPYPDSDEPDTVLGLLFAFQNTTGTLTPSGAGGQTQLWNVASASFGAWAYFPAYQFTNELDFISAIPAANPQPIIDDLALFGVAGAESAPMLITKIIPGQDRMATITAVDYAPDVYNAEVYGQPVETAVGELAVVPSPNLNDPQSNDLVLLLSPSGSKVQKIVLNIAGTSQANLEAGTQILLQYRISPTSNTINTNVWSSLASYVPNEVAINALDITAQPWICIQANTNIQPGTDNFVYWDTLDTDTPWTSMPPQPLSGEVSLTNVETGTAYDIRAAYVLPDGSYTPWSDTITHVVVGQQTGPVDVASVSASLKTLGSVLISWPRSISKNVLEYEIRSGATWATGTFVAAVRTTSFTAEQLPVGTYTYWVGVIDTSGNESPAPISVSFVVSTTGITNYGQAVITGSGGIAMGNIVTGGANRWSTGTAFKVGQLVIILNPGDSNTYGFMCITQGSTAGSQPAWNFTDGSNTNENTGTLVWLCVGVMIPYSTWTTFASVTLTIAASSNRVQFLFHGSYGIGNWTNEEEMQYQILMDGVNLIDGLTHVSANQTAHGLTKNGTLVNIKMTGITAGSHVFALQFQAVDGSGTNKFSVEIYGGTFSVEEAQK